MEKKVQTKKGEKKLVVGAVSSRGRVFQGYVTKKFDKRVVIEFERTIYVRKYERFAKKKTKLHARIPTGVVISIGDYVKIKECRPLSKIVNFVVVDVLTKTEEVGK
jgi:small subunit ribosomal protein S17